MTLAPWVLTVFFSMSHYVVLIDTKPCALFNFWPYCFPSTTLQTILRNMLLTVVFGLFVVQTWWLYSKDYYQEWFFSKKKFLIYILPCLALFSFPFTSADTFFYFRVGDAAQTVNPYITERITTNPFLFPHVESSVAGVMYGPITVQLMARIAQLAHGSYAVFLLLWKFFLLASSIFIIWMLFRHTASSRHNSLMLALSPLLLWEWLAVGHFDVLWLLTVLLAYLFAKRNQWIWVWPMLTIGIWLKFLPILLAPWFFLWWWSKLTKATWKRLTFELGVGGVISGVITFLSWAPYWTDWSIFSTISMQSKWAVHTVFASIYYLLKPLAELAIGGNYHWWLTRALHAALFVFVVYLLWPQVKFVFHSLRHPSLAKKELILWSMLYTFSVFLFVWQKSFWPWYALWPIVLSQLLSKQAQERFFPITVWLFASSMVMTGVYQFGFHQGFLIPFTIISMLAIQVPVMYHLITLRSYFPSHETATNT